MQLFVTCFGETKCVDFNAQDEIHDFCSTLQTEFQTTTPLELHTSTGRLSTLTGLANNSTIFARLSLVGGGKKKGGKKRKAYATPKKNKHKHKNDTSRNNTYSSDSP